MSDVPDANLLSQCQLEIELAWNDGEGRAAVHRLVTAHPELATELYEFFADVEEADDHLDRPRPEFAETDRKIRELLNRTRQDSQPTRPKTFLALAREVTGESVEGIAASMEITPDFLVVVSKHRAVLPRKAREELVRRVRGIGTTRNIDESDAIASFDVPSNLRRAASRDTAYAPSTLTYHDLVNHSSLSAEEKRFWLGLA